jgi:hypothetical protein
MFRFRRMFVLRLISTAQTPSPGSEWADSAFDAHGFADPLTGLLRLLPDRDRLFIVRIWAEVDLNIERPDPQG